MPAKVTTMGCNITRAFSRRLKVVRGNRGGNEGVAEDAGGGFGS